MADLSLILIHEKETQTIHIGLQNDTAYPFILDGEITFNGPDPVGLSGPVEPHTKSNLGIIPFDQINDYPHFEMSLERHSTQGHEETIERKIKPKPKHFLKLELLRDWNHKQGREYLLWSDEDREKKKESISPKAKMKTSYENPTQLRQRLIRDLSELATLSQEVDLHASALFDDLKSVKPEDIFHRQMETFRRYLVQAKSSGIDRVFIIHGVGSGKLKTAISRVLEYDRDVASFTNEYHPKYGFGATEVVFK